MKNKGRPIVGAKEDSKGNIRAVKVKGNSTFTPLKTAISMAKKGQIDALVVKPANAKEHLRTRPDNKVKNNLDELAKKP
jgi:hypothetical protein